MAKRQPNGAGRKGAEPEYHREMRTAFGLTGRDGRPIDNRTLIPQLMRELVAVHGGRRSLPPQQRLRQPQLGLQPSASSRFRRTTSVPPREPSRPRVQFTQPGPSSQAGPTSQQLWPSSLPGPSSNPGPSSKPWSSSQLGPSAEPGPSSQAGQSCVSGPSSLAGPSTLAGSSCQAGPSSQGVQRPTTAASKWREFAATRHPKARVTPIPEVHVYKKNEGKSLGEMTIKADVHQGERTAMKTASGGQLSAKYPDNRPTATAEIHHQQEFEDKKQQEIQQMLTDDERFQLDTQLAIHNSLEEAVTQSSDGPLGENETMMMGSQEKQGSCCDSEMSCIVSPQPIRRNKFTPVGMNAQYSANDDSVMLTAKGEAETNNAPGPVCISPPKPARLYVHGVNVPPGMMETISSVVPRVSNVQCPPPDPNDLIWDNIMPAVPAEPQDLCLQQQPNTCFESFRESFRRGIHAMGRCLRVFGNCTWRYLCHCEAVPGTCAYKWKPEREGEPGLNLRRGSSRA